MFRQFLRRPDIQQCCTALSRLHVPQSGAHHSGFQRTNSSELSATRPQSTRQLQCSAQLFSGQAARHRLLQAAGGVAHRPGRAQQARHALLLGCDARRAPGRPDQSTSPMAWTSAAAAPPRSTVSAANTGCCSPQSAAAEEMAPKGLSCKISSRSIHLHSRRICRFRTSPFLNIGEALTRTALFQFFHTMIAS